MTLLSGAPFLAEGVVDSGRTTDAVVMVPSRSRESLVGQVVPTLEKLMFPVVAQWDATFR